MQYEKIAPKRTKSPTFKCTKMILTIPLEELMMLLKDPQSAAAFLAPFSCPTSHQILAVRSGDWDAPLTETPKC